MRKHFLLFLLMSFLLPLGAWAEAVTLLTTTPQSREYNGTAPTITVKATAEGDALEGTWAASDGGVLIGDVPSKNAGVYTWTETAAPHRTATFTIIKKQVVYFLTGSTYAIGDKPDVTNHYSLATGNAFIGDDKLEDYAEFEFATSGNDALDLDNNGRFTTIKTYNIKALRVVEKNVHQNYDFRFTSTAAIVVTAKSIANFVSDNVADQKYTGSKIEPAAPAIYASAEDKAAKIALSASNYDVTYVSTSNANKNRNNIDVAKGGVIVYKGKGNYEGTLEVPFNIIPRPLKSVTVGSVAKQTYNFGTPIKPALTVTGKGDDNKDYPLTLTTDYTVNYNNTNENVSADGATGTLSAAGGSNFTFPDDDTKVGKAKFVIEPKSLADNDIAIDAIAAVTYDGNAKTPAGAIKWTIGETANNISENVDFTYEDNIAVGKATIIAKPKANADPQNYKGQKTSTFDIIPTALGEGVTIAFKKNVGTAQAPNWQNATYSYVAREIKPGTIEADGVLEVKDGDNVLKAGEDYEIVSYGDDTHDNKTAGDNKGIVTIKGIGNYGKISPLGDPITKSQEFNIAKATVTYTAADVTTTFGVAPAFSATNDVVEGESIGGKLAYNVEVNDGTAAEPNWIPYEGALTALAVDKQYRYKAAWTQKSDDVAPTPLPDGKTADDYDTKAQIDARANYNTAVIVYEYGKITVNNAKWIIVPDDKEKKYGVADDALTFTYKVYNGTVAAANLVAEPEFDRAPQIGRPANIDATPNNGEIVIGGGYKIAVLNQTGEGAVAKAGYTIECQTGTLTIVPFEITLTANDQTIYFGGEPNTDVTDESFIKDVTKASGYGNQLTVTYAPVMLGNGTLIERGDLGLKLTWDKNDAITGAEAAHEGALVPSVTNPNFKVVEANITKGKVTVLQKNAITLWDGDENVLDLINSYDTKTVNVSIKITERDRELGGKARTWAAGQWNTMTLPFDITVKELSQILGYAVVNVVDEGGYTTNEKGAPVYKFNLTMKGGYGKDVLPANKPFVVKTTDALAAIATEANDYTIDFGSRKIVAPTAADFAGVDAGGNSTFKPAYEVKEVSSANNGKIWFELGNSKNWAYIKSDSEAKWNIVPFEGFIDQNNTTAENPEAAIFVMEEIDGTTTVINGVEVDDINSLQNANAEGWYTLQGVKLESAPTEKGIYIFNGKKVAVQ